MSERSPLLYQPGWATKIKTVANCKICKSEHRDEIEYCLAVKAGGKLLADGVSPTTDWMMANAEALWGLKLYASNLATHAKHFVPGTGSTALEQRDARTEIRDVLETHGIPRVTADQYLEALVGIGYQKLLTEPDKITHDQVLKAIAELTKRKHDDATADLMRLLGEAQARALGQAGATLDKAIERIPHPNGTPPDEIEAEVVEDGDGEPSE